MKAGAQISKADKTRTPSISYTSILNTTLPEKNNGYESNPCLQWNSKFTEFTVNSVEHTVKIKLYLYLLFSLLGAERFGP